jgi:hypothetical protein
VLELITVHFINQGGIISSAGTSITALRNEQILAFLPKKLASSTIIATAVVLNFLLSGLELICLYAVLFNFLPSGKIYLPITRL